MKQKLIDTENKPMVARGEFGGVMGRKGKGDYEIQMSSYKISHKGMKYSIDNIVNSIVINMYVGR